MQFMFVQLFSVLVLTSTVQVFTDHAVEDGHLPNFWKEHLIKFLAEEVGEDVVLPAVIRRAEEKKIEQENIENFAANHPARNVVAEQEKIEHVAARPPWKVGAEQEKIEHVAARPPWKVGAEQEKIEHVAARPPQKVGAEREKVENVTANPLRKVGAEQEKIEHIAARPPWKVGAEQEKVENVTANPPARKVGAEQEKIENVTAKPPAREVGAEKENREKKAAKPIILDPAEDEPDTDDLSCPVVMPGWLYCLPCSQQYHCFPGWNCCSYNERGCCREGDTNNETFRRW